MSGHDLLPGCRTPWKHDCPGMVGTTPPGGTGGTVCHCPCHPLERELEELAATADRFTAAWDVAGAGFALLEWRARKVLAEALAEQARRALDGHGRLSPEDIRPND